MDALNSAGKEGEREREREFRTIVVQSWLQFQVGLGYSSSVVCLTYIDPSCAVQQVVVVRCLFQIKRFVVRQVSTRPTPYSAFSAH